MLVSRVDEVAQPVVDKLLCECACLHVGIHIQIGHLEALVLQHRTNRDDIWVNLTPRQWLDSGIDNIGTVVTNLEDRCHRQTRTRVTMVLNDDIGVLGLDGLGELTQHSGLTDTSHILQTDFLGTSSDHLVGNSSIVLNGVNWRSGDTQCSLRCHATLLGPLDTWNDITGIV